MKCLINCVKLMHLVLTMYIYIHVIVCHQKCDFIVILYTQYIVDLEFAK